jgi:hypothetical protein
MAKWFRSPFFRKKNQMFKGFKKIERGNVFSQSYSQKLKQRAQLLRKYGVPKKEIKLLMQRWPVVKAAIIADEARCNCSVNVAKHILDLMLENRKAWVEKATQLRLKNSKGVSQKEARAENTNYYDQMLTSISKAIQNPKPTPDKKSKNWDSIDNIEGFVRRADAILLPEAERNSEIILLPKMALMTTGQIVSNELHRLLGDKYSAFVEEDAALKR